MSTSDRRFQAALAIMQGLAASLEWRAGLITHPEEMAADAVAMADALSAALEKIAELCTCHPQYDPNCPVHPLIPKSSSDQPTQAQTENNDGT